MGEATVGFEETLSYLDGIFSWDAGVDEEGKEFGVGEDGGAEAKEAFAGAVVLGEVRDAIGERGWVCGAHCAAKSSHDAAVVEQLMEVGGGSFEGLAIDGVREAVEFGDGFFEEIHGVFDGAFDGTFIVGDAGEDGGVHGFAFEEHAVELGLLGVGGVHEEIKDGQGQFAFDEVGAEGFADLFFVAYEVEAVIINLIDGSKFEAVTVEGFLDVVALAIQSGAELGGDGEEGGGLHFNDAEVFSDGEVEIEAALSLEDFTGADVA